MRATKKNSGVYQYLHSIGVLEMGTDEEISRARKKYFQEYKRNWRRNNRKKNKELTITFNQEEYTEVTQASRKHHRSRTRFIKEAALAYMHKSFVIPNELEVRRIREILTMNYNALETLIEKHPLAYFQSGRKLLDTFMAIEKEILTLLHHPESSEEILGR